MATPQTTEAIQSFDMLFHTAESGTQWWVRDFGGSRYRLPVERWLGGEYATADDRVVDEALLRLCRGRTLDLACGPGRLVGELRRRGAHALGVDSSAGAVELSRSRGAQSLLGDIFETLPDEGRWDTVLLLDGNIGIGGDPARVIARAHEIASPGGSVFVEVEGAGTGLVAERLRIESDRVVGEWYDWARIDADTLAVLAHAVGLVSVGTSVVAGRYFAHFDKPGPRPRLHAVTSSCTPGD
ncbi:MAG: methyltransferase domain-containing protein [Rhodococcus sp. (in: high G+C Gram-positive bacteria)]